MRGKSILFNSLLYLLLLTVVCPAVFGKIIYVDNDTVGLNDGTSWENAYVYLQDALADANDSEKPIEIRVAAGTYKPDQGAEQTPGDRGETFQLIDNITIKGGFAGLREPDLNARDIELYKTILSGDLKQDDGLESMNISDNSYHVVTSNRIGQTAVLDGVTITAGGHIDSYSLEAIDYLDRGGGMYNDCSSPTLINCTFIANNGRAGAGMFNYYSSPILTDCTFLENSADEYGGGMFNSYSNPSLFNCAFITNSASGDGSGFFTEEGGGIYNDFSKPNLLNCTFTENTAGYTGGGIYNARSEPVMTNCTFNHNSAYVGGGIYNSGGTITLADCHFNGNFVGHSGGAVYNDSGVSTFFNCTFKGNTAIFDGGAIFNNINRSNHVRFTNCIFSRNSARNGGAIQNERVMPYRTYRIASTTDNYYSAMYLNNCTLSANFAENAGGGIFNYRYESVESLRGLLIINNCILWSNTPDEIQKTPSESVTVLYSDVQGGFTGQGNIEVDPLFADPNNDDYHLKSHAGRWNPVGQSWVIDDVTSPCIDAGDPNAPIGLECFPNGGIINMGAYGGTQEASLSPRQQYTLPDQASNPSPMDKAISVDVNTTLIWNAGSGAVLHTVYLGTDYNDVQQSNINVPGDVLVSVNQRNTSFYPGILEYAQKYFWRIDEIDHQGNITIGDIWKFDTIKGKGRACFTGQTLIWINGSFIPILKADIGQSTDGINRIEEVQEHEGTFTLYDVLLESGKSITVAENHYFMTETGRWISFKKLLAGMNLKTARGMVGIKSITKRPSPYIGKVYNLKIQGSDRYMVGEDAVIVRDY